VLGEPPAHDGQPAPQTQVRSLPERRAHSPLIAAQVPWLLTPNGGPNTTQEAVIVQRPSGRGGRAADGGPTTSTGRRRFPRVWCTESTAIADVSVKHHEDLAVDARCIGSSAAERMERSIARTIGGTLVCLRGRMCRTWGEMKGTPNWG